MKSKIHNLKRRAFTLVELIIVIAVITILAGIVVVAINPASIFANARNGQRANDINTIQNAIVRYLGDATVTSARSLSDFPGYSTMIQAGSSGGAYSTTPTGACSGGSSGGVTFGNTTPSTYFTLETTTAATKLNLATLTTATGNYLPKVPTDPTGSTTYYRACIDTSFATPGKLVLYSVGEAVNGTTPQIYAVI